MSGLSVYAYRKPFHVFTCLGRLLCFVGRRNSKPSIKIIPFLIILLLLSITLSAWAEESSRIQLTPAEKAWLTAHPEVVLGAPTDYPPMVIKRKDGTHVGVLVDFFEEISKILNHRISLHIEDSWADIQEKAQNRELDGLAFGGKDPRRAALYNPTNVLMSTYFSVFARSKIEFQLKRFLDLKGMRIGYKRAARPTRSLLEKLPSAILKPYESHEAMTQALLQNEIDVIVAWISYDHWRKERLQGTIDNILLIDEYPIEMVSHIRKDWPELVSILNKALLALKKDEVPRITNKWFGEWPNRALREHESQQLAIILTPQEQAWLKEHPEITVGSSSSYPPHVIKNPDGTYTGVNIDFYEQISQVLNTKFKLHVEDVWSNVQKKAKNREIDGLTIVGRDPTRDLHYNATDIIYPSYFSVFADSRDDLQIKRFSDLDGMRIGYKRGARPARTRLEKLPSAIIKPYDSHESMTQALLTNEIDVIVAWMSYDHWRKKTLQGTIDKIYLIKEFPLEMVGYFRKDWPQVIPIVNKAIAVLQKNELPRIIEKWFGEWPQSDSHPKVHLTPEEKAWLAQKNTVRVRVGEHPPWLMNIPEPAGMAVDYLRIIGKQFGINFKLISDNEPWIEGFKDIAGEHLKFDLYPTANRTPERLQYLAMSDPYLYSPWVVFTRNNLIDIFGVEDLRGRKLAVESGYVMQKLIKKTEPEIEQVLVKDTKEALLAVSTGKAEAYIGNLIVASFLLEQEGITNIKVSGATPYGDHSQAMATRKEWAPLITIINKGLKNIPEKDKTSIRNKYLSIRYEHGITIADVMKWILIVTGSSAGIVLFFVFWNKQLSSKVKERTSQLMETESRFRATFDQVAVGVAHVSLEGIFQRVNEKFCDIVGYSKEEMFGLTFKDITHPDDLELDLSYVEQVLKGERENFSLDKRYFRKDGSVIWVNLTVSLLFDRGGRPQYFVSVIKDISERKRAEENLSNSESKYRGLVDNSIVGVFNTNVKGEFLFVNKAMAEMCDFDSPENMLAEGSLPRWADQKQREQMLSELKQHGIVNNFEAESITNTGRHIYILFSAKMLGENIFGMVMDITQRKKVELQLQESLIEIERLNDLREKESAYLQEEIKLEHNFENIIGNSDAIQYALFKVEQVAETDSTVLILGETGTGKELIARAIHHSSQRNKRPLIKINCATLPANLIESELFGHEKGSFTGAVGKHMGRFEVADGSTLFLDEIGELPFELQAKLLRVLEDGEFERLGSTKTQKVDVRIIAATNRKLEKDVSERRFRQDLWYRLNVFPITLPPLRDRIEDIPMIVQYYMDIFTRKLGKKIDSIPVKVIKSLQNYTWPGNVRELENVLERSVISTSGAKLQLSESLSQSDKEQPEGFKSLYDMERDYIASVLEETGWKVSGKNSAAEILGLDRSTLRARMKKLDIHK